MLHNIQDGDEEKGPQCIHDPQDHRIPLDFCFNYVHWADIAPRKDIAPRSLDPLPSHRECNLSCFPSNGQLTCPGYNT